MHSDKILPTYKKVGETQHFTRRVTALYTDTPEQTIINLKRAALTADVVHTVSTVLPDIGEVKNIPSMPISPSASLLIGDTWVAVVDLYVPETT
jgi:hypothetical protein